MSTALRAASMSRTHSPNGQGLANVNPIFTWVRLAQRIPVRVHIDQVPEGVDLSAGMTATVQIDPRPRQLAKRNRRASPSRVEQFNLHRHAAPIHIYPPVSELIPTMLGKLKPL
jgi:hypothetical protein